MKKRLLFRTFTVLLAAITLLSSTSAYNLLVYANQEIVSDTLSATETDDSYEPNITIQGGDLQLETNAEGDTEGVAFSWGTDANGNPADGSEQNPYQISSLEHFLQVNTLVNDTTGSSVADVNNKYFVLTADIDISSLTPADFANKTGVGSAYFVTTDHMNANSQQVYINIDGSYIDADGQAQRHRITGGEDGWNIEIAGYQLFSIFGYLGQNSVISNIIFENINANVTNDSPVQVSIIANKNDGVIENCTVSNCSVVSALSKDHSNPYNVIDGVYFYNGIAGAVADNCGTIRNLSVNNIDITLGGTDDYIGCVVGQNRGLVKSTSVSGIRINATSNNHYIGGIAGYNEPDDTSLGIQSCSVDMAGPDGKANNFTNGGYVGGIVGSNDGYLYDSSVTGTFSSADKTTAVSYNILGYVDAYSANLTYFGGAAGISTGVISAVTVSDVGFYANASNSIKQAYFGGITSTVESSYSIVNCVASGVFAASDDAKIYAGGIIGYATDNIADAAIDNTFALYKIINPGKDYVGAVIGWGGNSSALSDCYWSDQLSGCSVSYVQHDVFYSDLVANAEAINGNLYSSNRAVIAPRNSSVTVSASSLTHSWDGSGVYIGAPLSDVAVPTNGLANSFASVPYTVEFTFPAGVGSSDKNEMEVSFNIDVLVTTAQGDPDDINNPMEISSSAQVKYLSLVPYGHYILTNNVSVSTSAWDAPVFTGTLNGNGHTITTDGSIFTAVVGARKGDIGSALDASTYSTNPAADNLNYLTKGYIYNLNADLSENITNSVFGNIINSTFVNVSLTDGDVATDDSDDDTFDGFYATISDKREATFAAAANGFSYIYGCSTGVSVNVVNNSKDISNNDIALFIGKLSGSVTVDNCYVNGNMYIKGGNEGNFGRAVFLGNTSENEGYILNSTVCTWIHFDAGSESGVYGRHCAVVFGQMDHIKNLNKYKNIVWSKNFGSDNDANVNASFYPVGKINGGTEYDKTQIVLWGATGETYPEKTVAAGNSAGFDISIPHNIKSFEGVYASDFAVSANKGSESPLEITGITVENGKLRIVVKAKMAKEGETLPDNLNDWVRIFHQPSGLTAFVRVFVKESGLSFNAEDGYYHIVSESDLRFLSTNFNVLDPNGSGTTYREAAYILDGDIYMTAPINPIGNATNPFTGVFTGQVDENGNPLYTIHNLTFDTTSDNIALFGAVDFSSEDMTIGTSQTTVQRGISNIAISGASVDGGENAAVLVAYAKGPSGTKNYGTVNISNIVIGDSKITAGNVTDKNSGKAAAAVLAYAENVKININAVRLNDVEVISRYFPSTPRYFMHGNTAGIGGVIGNINESLKGNMDETMAVCITDVQIDGISLSSTGTSEKTYSMTNIGGVVGLFYTTYSEQTTKYPTLTIGNPSFSGEGYDVTVKDIVVMTQGVGGGVLGAANVRTDINYAYVTGTKSPIGVEAEELESLPTRIWGKTELYLGGIAGYIGAVVPESNYAKHYYPSLENVYGSVNGSKVENADIRAIIDSGTVLKRNVTVGGIVGAINGYKDSTAVSSSQLVSSNLEGIVIGGIVGSSIDTFGRVVADYEYINAPVFANSINIDSCSVNGSQIRTLEGVIPVDEIYDAIVAYGVGGILGTNRRSLTSYAMHTSISRCSVDAETVITNTITPSTDNRQVNIHSATGGILGSGFENGIENGELSVKNNEVYAKIITENSYPADTTLPAADAAFFEALTATGGLVGALIGTQYSDEEPENYEVCDLSKVKIQHGIFGGSITGTDGIGGVVGVISAASAYTSANDLPENLISDIAVTGQLESSLTTAVYHGGIAVGHIAVKTNGSAASDTDDFYVFDVAAGTDITGVFNRIYFSSFQVDADNFPVFGYHNAASANTSADTSLSANAKAILINCYEDVNKNDDNITNQFTDVSAGEAFTLPDSRYPLVSRPADGANAYSVTGQSWYGSNTDIATIKSTGPNNLVITPKNSGTIKVSINYVGTVGDGTWSRQVAIPAGFKFTSTSQAPLDTVVHEGQTYYIISNPYDVNLIGKTPGNTEVLSSELMSATYWIANDILLEDSLFVTNGIYDGGIKPIGTSAIPFSGVITSMPAGEYTSTLGTTYVSDGSSKTITGIQLATKNGTTNLTHVGLFAYAKGATFENFSLANVKATSTSTATAVNYMGALAALVQDNVTVNNVILSGLNLSGLNYVGGFFGGIVYSSVTTPSTITNSGVVGDTSDVDETGARIYSNIISGKYGAAGIVAHTSQYNTNMSGITVEDAKITQEYSNTDNGYFDYGAGGISLAFSGNITANGANRNRIEGCEITGEIAAGVITRTYNSTQAKSYMLYTGRNTTTAYPAIRATEVKISGTDVVATTVTGTHTAANTGTTMYNYSAVGGILARVDASYVEHEIIDCTLDSDTYVNAPFGAGGILGCFESANNASATYYDAEYPVIIDSCTTYATVEITDSRIAIPSSLSNRCCVGAGAILGYIGRVHSYAQTYIRNCTAGGVVRGNANIGGIVGAIWSTNTSFTFAGMDHHYAENCVVSAKLEVSDGAGGYISAFKNNIKGVGVVVGHPAFSSYIQSNSTYGKYLHPSSGNSFGNANYPFYNIYFSDDTYRGDNYVRLYGIPSGTTEYSLNGYAYYTDYIYNLNRTSEFSMAKANNNFAINFGNESYRIQLSNPPVESEKFVYKLNSNFVTNVPYAFNTNIFKLNTAVAGDAATYQINSLNGANNVKHFEAVANADASVQTGSETSEFVLESITCPDERVTITPVNLETGDFTISTTQLCAVVSYLEFNYTNGTKLCMQLEIENKPEDYWFRPQSGNAEVNDLLIFNAANLSYVRTMAATTSNIIQCYDVFWTVSNSDTIADANAAITGKTLADVYSAEFIADLGTYQHPNPEWDGTVAKPRFVTFDEMYKTSAATRGTVLLSELVGEIAATAFDVYGEESGSVLYNRDKPFAGTYDVLTSPGSEDYYKIYGFALHSTDSSETYPEYSGMFNVIGEGATISNITFIDPDIRATRLLGADNYVGVLAGEINGATVSNITVRKSSEKAVAQVLSLRTVSTANTYVGAVAGLVGEGTTLTNITVDGITVAGASTAGNRATQDKDIKNVFVGGVAGISSGTISDVTVNSSNILVNRDEASARGYISYAGSVAGKASGSISGAAVSATVSGCDVTVNEEVGIVSFTYEVNPSSEAGDRLGGVVGLANGTLTLSNVNINKISINAFDIAGGLIAEVNSDDATSVTISGCDIGNAQADEERAQITISGSSNITGKTYSREFYNAVGGAIGYVNEVASVRITDCDVAGYVGQYALEHKNCIAGGVIGLVDADIASLNSIVIDASTVQGEVAGYRRGAQSASVEYRMLGAAGGIIGKIYSFAKKSFNSSDKMISDSVMSAKVNLYDSVNGSTVKADYATLENQSDTHVGKIIGELRNDDSGDNFAYTAGTANDSNILFTNYVNNVYVSSYPQNIVAYGCSDFYTNQNNNPAATYVDINTENRYMASDAEAPENVSSFMVDGSVVDVSDPSVQHNYDTGTYSGVAIITFDEDQAATSASRHFRLAYDSLVFKEGKDAIEFNGGFNISVENGSDDLKDVTVSSSDYQSSHRLTESVTLDSGSTHSYNYYTGVITVNSNENVDIVGYISAGYSYGLEVGIQFVSMEIAGNGTEQTPFEVAKPKHFKVVRALRGAFYKQVANIDFADSANNQYNTATEGAMYADIKGIEPIGTSSAPFTGNYNGQGYVISNVYIGRSDENNVGFFGYVGNGNNKAILRNIHIELASELDITDENANITTVAGGITGKEGVGGLVGYAYNASITNCSVANGFVMGQTRVGGLVGRTGNVHLDSCFTSTSTYSYATPAYGDASTVTVGALIGYAGGQAGICNSFTLGLASVGTTNTYGAAGGMVGYNGSTLTITDSLIGATVSDYTGTSTGDGTLKGLTVGGMAGTGASVTVGNVIVAPTNALSMRIFGDKTNYVNPIVGASNSGSISDVYVDTDVTGILNGSEPYNTVVKTADGLYNFNVSTAADVAGDAYTAAYVAAAVIPIEVSEKEIADREILSNKGNPGFFYPITLNHGGSYSFASSVIDLSDTVAYPDGIDADMYGIKNENGVNKNTDLLFCDEDGKTTVYANVYPFDNSDKSDKGAVLKDGTVYTNGEVAYDSAMPYLTISAPATVKEGLTVEVTRKVVYPIQNRTEYPIATARQFFAMSNSAEAVEGSKFFDFYTLNGIGIAPERDYTVVADINLGSVNFTPIIGYSGEFDGNGFTVSNLRIDMPGNNEVGLFRTLSGGAVKNLTVGVDTINANDNVGALVGAIIVKDTTNTAINASARIENCHAVLSDGGEGIVATGRNIGGLVGATTRSSGDSGIIGSSSSVKVSGYDVVGGLVGYSETPVDNSYATGEVNAKFTSGSSATQVHPWFINGTQGIAGVPVTTGTEHGAGGVVGVLRKSSADTNVASASVSYCFGSGIVTVTDAAYANGVPYGVGGLVGVNCANTSIETSFSSGNVYYCYGNGSLTACNGATVGVGGLVGVMYSGLNDVYSSASIAADFGNVESAVAVGAGGVAGVAYEKLSSAYSSGATLGTTSTPDYSNCNYGAGGVIGVLDYSASTCSNLIFDLNLSITDQVVGKILSGSYEENNSGAKTTKYLTAGSEADGGEKFMSLKFGYVKGAYPYLTNFFRNEVSLTIRINALLSVVALQLNELDVSAANGDGISMALNIPTSFEYKYTGNDDSDNVGVYTYSYSDKNNLVDAAQGVIDEVTDTLSIQRTQNEAQYVNFVISIDAKDGNTSDANGNVYADVATRLVSRLCAPMLGTQTHPYLVATQKDLEHVGMTSAELSAVPSDPAYKMYTQWATPILENGTPTEGVVNFRLMGYVPLTDYSRAPIADLTNESYTLAHNGSSYNIAYKGISFDGNGYSIRNLSSRLFAKLDSQSILRNMTFENVNFADESLIGEVDGTVEGVNIYGVASGSNTAGVANTVNQSGKIIGSVVNLDYNDSSSVSNVAGVALTNNGEIRKCASVGNFGGGAVSGMGGMVVTNTGTIVDSFTIGNMQFKDATNLGGFVNTNNGSIQNCYTRCNIIISANPADRVIGGFVAHNNIDAIIKNAYSSGMFKLAADTAPLNIFAAQSAGTLTDCMFDKQMSGSTFSNIYDMAERTLDIVSLTNHSSMKGTYEVKEPAIDASTNTYHNIYYPQLSSILNTEAYETQINDKGEEVQVETVTSRMYRVLRAYSFISSATALVGNDNYIDNLALGSSTALSYDSLNSDLWRKTSGSDLASATYFGSAGSGVNGRRIAASTVLPDGYDPAADNTTVISAIKPVKDFYDLAIEDAQLDLFVEVTGAAHPNFAGGQGTADAPFEISTPEQFVALSFYGTSADNNFKVINDIDMSSAEWTSYIDNFKANLNGDGKAVYNVTISADGNDSLFGKINGGKIDKLGVAGIDVAADGASGGMLASSATGGASITNTYVVGTLTTAPGSDQINIGGFVGEIDSSTIDGCVVSGKINSDASTTGGVVGSALDDSVIANVLSTVYVDGGAGTAAGIVGTATDSAEITSCVFASDVKGGTKGNIVGDGTAGDSYCYYDNQMSSVIDGADGRTTYYLTGGATTEELFGEGTAMTFISGFAGYPLPSGMMSGSDNFLAGLKLASAKLNLASGAGAGTLSSFTTITAPASFGKLTFSGGTPSYLVSITDTQINTDTAMLALGVVENRQVTYTLGDGSFDGGKMFRFVDVFVGKTLKVTYVFDNLASGANSVLTAYSGMSNVSAVTAFVTKDKHTDILCSSMVIPYDADEGAYIIRVGAELESDYAVNTVKADVLKNGANALDTIDGSYIVNNGTYKLAIAGGSEIDCDEIVITVNVKDAPWGIHNYFNIF